MANLDTLHNANFPVDDEGRVYHLGVKEGDVAPRVLSVGDAKRAELIATTFIEPSTLRKVQSHRGFATYTGTYKNTEVSVIATGMGKPMMDFVVRETRAVVKGPMAFVRLGTAGSPHPDVVPGTVVCATKGSVSIDRDVNAFRRKSPPYYTISDICQPHARLAEEFEKQVRSQVTFYPVHSGLDVTADSFYSSQGRQDANFVDHNETLVDELCSKYPEAASLQMETFHLFDMAESSAPHAPIAAAAGAIIMFNRLTGAGLPHTELRRLELAAGEAALAALVAMPLEEIRRASPAAEEPPAKRQKTDENAHDEGK